MEGLTNLLLDSWKTWAVCTSSQLPNLKSRGLLHPSADVGTGQAYNILPCESLSYGGQEKRLPG